MHWARKIVGRLIDNAQYYTRRVWYPIRCWLRPYNVVRIKTLPGGWTDRTEILLHASFQVLVDFVEKEESIDQSSDLIRRRQHFSITGGLLNARDALT